MRNTAQKVNQRDALVTNVATSLYKLEVVDCKDFQLLIIAVCYGHLIIR